MKTRPIKGMNSVTLLSWYNHYHNKIIMKTTKVVDKTDLDIFNAIGKEIEEREKTIVI